MRSVRAMGLEVAPHKTEALYFYSRAKGRPSSTHIRVGDVHVLVGPTIKYLDLTLMGSGSLWNTSAT
jgi:hypothetical protein